SYVNTPAQAQKPQTPASPTPLPTSTPPSTSPRREPSASRQVMPLGPMSVPPFWNQMLRVAGPTGPAKGPSESPTAVAAMVSALLVAAPAYRPPTTSTTSRRSSVANCDRPVERSVAPGAHALVKNPDTRLTAAVSLDASRAVPESSPPPGGTLSATPPNATARSSRTTAPP